MTIVISAIAFFLLLTLLVLVHEWGHYAAARRAGVTVEEFGFGLPPRAKKLFTYKRTLFSLNWIPFGGFVKLKGENSIDPKVRNQKGSFAGASIHSRILILLAGVFMNFLVAIALFTMGFWVWQWIPTYLDIDSLARGQQRGEVAVEWGLYVADVLEDGEAAKAGLQKEGVLKAINGEGVRTVEQVLSLQEEKRSVTYTLLYPKEGADDFTEEKTFTVGVSAGKTGVALSEFALDIEGKRRSLPDGVRLAFRETWIVVAGTVEGVGKLLHSLFREQSIPGDIAGIVGIAQITHESLKEGVMVYLRLVALLSLSLAVLNVLPFPALDGGRMVFVLFEMLSGHPVNRRLEVVTNGVGILFLMLLMAAVTWNDILRIFSSPPI
jgi:regulator of sigma E protease